MISLCPFRENNINNVIDTTFSVENNSFGAVKVHELKNQGSNIPVTEENKKEYVKLYVNYRFMRGIEQQFLALQKVSGGFYWGSTRTGSNPWPTSRVSLSSSRACC